MMPPNGPVVSEVRDIFDMSGQSAAGALLAAEGIFYFFDKIDFRRKSRGPFIDLSLEKQWCEISGGVILTEGDDVFARVQEGKGRSACAHLLRSSGS